MSTGAIIAIIVVAIIIIAVIAIALPRMRANARERELARRRGAVAEAHRDRASDRSARAEEAEQIAARERAEAELHETRARLHERGLADDELAADRATTDPERSGDRFDRGRDEGSVTSSTTDYERGRRDEARDEGR
jgi:FtsZ-interacting cell division protein ZipA